MGCYLNGAARSDSLSVLVYAEVYTSLMPKAQGGHTLPKYVYSYHRANELAVNMGLVDVAWQPDKRTKLALGMMTGTYAQTNLQQEPGVFQFLYEANISYALSTKKRLTMQAGVFPSHIGMESAIGGQNAALSRSLQADNSPYYESGLKLTHGLRSERGSVSILLLNGWQTMVRGLGQTKPAFGHQIYYTPNARWVLSSSSFVGSMDVDSLNKVRLFHDAWFQYQVHPHWQLSGGFDLGYQRRGRLMNGGDWWSTIQALVRYEASKRWGVTARWERVNDRNQFLFLMNHSEARRIHGYSINADCRLTDALRWRSEIRCLKEHLSAPRWIGTVSLVCLLQK